MEETISAAPKWYSSKGIKDRLYTYWYLAPRTEKFMDIVGLALSFMPIGAARAAQYITRVPIYTNRGLAGWTIRASDWVFRLEGRHHVPLKPHKSPYFGPKWAKGAGLDTDNPLALFVIDKQGLRGLLQRKDLYFRNQDVVLRSARVGDLLRRYPQARLVHDHIYAGEGFSYIFGVSGP